MVEPFGKKIKVTQEIIDKSMTQHAGRCIVAQAVRSQIPGAWSIRVNAETVKFNLGGEPGTATDEQPGYVYCYALPAVANKNIIAFDDDPTSVQPFSFQLDKRQCTIGEVVKKKDKGSSTPRPKSKSRCNRGRKCSVRRFAGLSVVSG